MKRVTIQVPEHIYQGVVRKEPWAMNAMAKVEEYAKRLGTFYELVQKPTITEKLKEAEAYVEKELEDQRQADGWDDYGSEDHGDS